MYIIFYIFLVVILFLTLDFINIYIYISGIHNHKVRMYIIFYIFLVVILFLTLDFINIYIYIYSILTYTI